MPQSNEPSKVKPLRKSGPLKPAGDNLSISIGIDGEDIVVRKPDGTIERHERFPIRNPGSDKDGPSS